MNTKALLKQTMLSYIKSNKNICELKKFQSSTQCSFKAFSIGISLPSITSLWKNSGNSDHLIELDDIKKEGKNSFIQIFKTIWPNSEYSEIGEINFNFIFSIKNENDIINDFIDYLIVDLKNFDKNNLKNDDFNDKKDTKSKNLNKNMKKMNKILKNTKNNLKQRKNFSKQTLNRIFRDLFSIFDEKSNFKNFLTEKIKNYIEKITKIDIECKIDHFFKTVHFSGKYCKFSRKISHSKWFLNDKKFETSIEEICSELLKEKFRASNYKFFSAGREDADTKMLGEGRPFLVELKNPQKFYGFDSAKNETILQEIMDFSNRKWTEKVQIKGLKIANNEVCKKIKNWQNSKNKIYRCLVKSFNKIDQKMLNKLIIKNPLTISQKTPIRVLHRRVLSTRKKIVHEISSEFKNDFSFNLILKTSSGTYIKEFVSGDKGRTKPNVTELLGTQCIVEELDVLDLCDFD